VEGGREWGRQGVGSRRVRMQVWLDKSWIESGA
jgi:hypothetical protein